MGQEHLRNLFLIDGVDVTAIFEPDSIMRDECRRLVSDSNFVETEEDVIRSENVDALIITSPNYLHFDQLKKIVEIRKIPILIEKPVCTSLEQLKDLKKINNNYSSPIWVAMEYRYMPVISKLLEIIRSQQILGKMISLNIREHRYPFLKKVGNWNRFNKKTGGTLVEKCCHFFDLMRLVIQSEPIKVYASGSQDVNHLEEKYDGKTPDIIDNAYVIVDFENGVRGMLDLCMFAENSEYQEEIVAVGDIGKIETFVPSNASGKDSSEVRIGLRKDNVNKSKEVKVDKDILAAGHHHGSTYFEHLAFINAIQKNKKPDVSLRDGLMSVAIGEAAENSIVENRVVFMKEFNL